jgi:hypothetical protein
MSQLNIRFILKIGYGRNNRRGKAINTATGLRLSQNRLLPLILIACGAVKKFLATARKSPFIKSGRPSKQW